MSSVRASRGGTADSPEMMDTSPSKMIRVPNFDMAAPGTMDSFASEMIPLASDAPSVSRSTASSKRSNRSQSRSAKSTGSKKSVGSRGGGGSVRSSKSGGSDVDALGELVRSARKSSRNVVVDAADAKSASSGRSGRASSKKSKSGAGKSQASQKSGSSSKSERSKTSGGGFPGDESEGSPGGFPADELLNQHSLVSLGSKRSQRSQRSNASSLPSYDSAAQNSTSSAQSSKMSLNTKSRLLDTMRLAAERAASRTMSKREASALIDAMTTAMDIVPEGKDEVVAVEVSMSASADGAVEESREAGEDSAVRGGDDRDGSEESGREDVAGGAEVFRRGTGREETPEGNPEGASEGRRMSETSDDSLTYMADNTVQGLQFQTANDMAADPSQLTDSQSASADQPAAEDKPAAEADQPAKDVATDLDNLDIKRTGTDNTEMLVNQVREEISQHTQNFVSSILSFTSVLSVMSVVEEVDDMAIEVRADIEERMVENEYDREEVKERVDRMVQEEINGLLKAVKLSDGKEAKLLATYEGKEDVLIAHLRRLRDMDDDDEKDEEDKEEEGEEEGDEPADETSETSSKSAKSTGDAKSTSSASGAKSVKSAKSAMSASAKSTKTATSAMSAKTAQSQSTKSIKSAGKDGNSSAAESNNQDADQDPIEPLLQSTNGAIQTKAKTMVQSSTIAHKESKLMAKYEGREDALIAHLQRLEEDQDKGDVVLEEGKLVKKAVDDAVRIGAVGGVGASGRRLNASGGSLDASGRAVGRKRQSRRGLIAGRSVRFSKPSMRSFRRSKQKPDKDEVSELTAEGAGRGSGRNILTRRASMVKRMQSKRGQMR